MSKKAPRTPAGEVGTDHRVDTGYGHYWVRLTTRGAILLEGECMSNCCRHGQYDGCAGPEGLTEKALWSLRRLGDGVSIALMEVGESGHLIAFKGPMNNPPSGLAYRQLRQLRAYLVAGGADLKFSHYSVLVDEAGNTYRPDKAPEELRAAIEAKRTAGGLPAIEVRSIDVQEYIRRIPPRIQTAGLQAVAQAFREMRDSAFLNMVIGQPRREISFSAPRPSPPPALSDLASLLSPQARMRAVRENREARLADRQWVRDNERAQRRLAR